LKVCELLPLEFSADNSASGLSGTLGGGKPCFDCGALSSLGLLLGVSPASAWNRTGIQLGATRATGFAFSEANRVVVFGGD